MNKNKLRIGIVGLGDIAQKVYLPFLTKESNWKLVGAYSPTESKRNLICQYYRLSSFSNITDLIRACDAIFVHSSTQSHFEIISQALLHGKDVYVDKPLAATLPEAEKLVTLSIKTGRKLMVGFNRRFAPMYIKVRQCIQNSAWIRIEKHRINSMRPVDFAATLLDDYIHLADTARWLGEPVNSSITGHIKINEDNQLLYAQHTYTACNNTTFFIGMHRKSGTNLEQLEIVGDHAIVRVKNMDTMEIEQDGALTTNSAGSWETIIKRRGFEDAILHFFESVYGDTPPCSNGEEALKTQQLVHDIIQKARNCP